MDIYELARLLNNLIRLGVVTKVRHGQPSCVRVKTGELTTNWIPFITHRAGNVKTWSPPSVGEQVVLMSPGGDLVSAVALTGVYSDSLAEPSSSPNEHVITFPDGARMQYDHGSGAMSITGIKSLTINASESTEIICPNNTIVGKLTVTDVFEYQAGMTGSGGSAGQTTIRGDITHEDGDLSSNGIVVHRHGHEGVIQGGDITEGPVTI